MACTNILFALFIVFCHFHFASSWNSRCREIERKALMDFKGSLTNTEHLLASWMGRDCCSWYGIICHNRTGFVQEIHLNRNYYDDKLGGHINSSLVNLEHLEYLDLSYNNFSGISIPAFLGSLRNLQHLYLSMAGFAGRIPTTLRKLTKLQYLNVYGNFLTGELSESFFEGLKNLEELCISANRYIVFNVSSQWIPSFQLKFIVMDDVSMGLRTTFPTWIQTQTNLRILSLRNASISGVFPNWLRQTSYPQLYSLDLSNNFLTGHVPTFDPNTPIGYLSLSNNEFTGNIPHELCNLSFLGTLELANNQLVGRIPICLGNLRRLRVLILSNNSLFGHVPNELGYLNQLTFLYLNRNKLFGELPSSLQNLTKLTTLDLGENELQGFIPNWIGKEFIHLEQLMLQSNNFSGEISLNLCQLQSLMILNLSDNNLVGTIPACFGNLRKMLSNNSDAFIFPDLPLNIISKGMELEYPSRREYAKLISLSGNHLHGKIPDELMDLTGLQSLNLSNNELTGKIPERIGNMKHLESLDLSNNQLSGTIPRSLADIDALGYLKLSFNNLSGRIPFGGHFETLNGLFVYEGNDELCGKPMAKKCGDDSMTSEQNELVFNGDDEFEIEWLYAGIGPGFAVGFLEVLCLLYFKSSWRYKYFRFLKSVYNRF